MPSKSAGPPVDTYVRATPDLVRMRFVSSGSPETPRCVEYHWPIDLKVYKHELVFHPSENGEIFENAPN